MPCANCRQDFLKVGGEAEAFDEFILSGLGLVSCTGGQQELTKKIPISSAIGTIFNANLKLCKKKISPACKLKMCQVCLNSLALLYEAFLRFMESTAEGSYVQQVIQKSSQWQSFGLQSHSDYVDSLSSLVDVKLEDEMDMDMDLHEVKNEIQDPDYIYVENLDNNEEEFEFPVLRRSTRKHSEPVRSSRKEESASKLPCHPRTASVDSKSPGTYKSLQASRIRKSKSKEVKIRVTRTRPPKSKVDSEGRVFKCPEANCTKSFHCAKLLRRHSKFKHGGATPEELAIRTCNLCDSPRIFCTPSELRIHQREVHATENPFACTICDRHFPTKNRLRIHTLVSHKRKQSSETRPSKEPHICPHNCPTPFATKVSLELHLKSEHNEVLSYKCTECEKTFQRNSVYQRHLKYKHGVGLTDSDLEGRICTLCPNSRVFETKSILMIHIASVHATEKPFACEVEGCERKFPTKNYLDIHHHTTHKEDRLRPTCNHCGKCFSSKSSLNEHIAGVHLGEKNVICDVCGKSFTRQADLNRHVLLHDPDRVKQLECPICSKLFISELTLKKHSITHSGTRDHLCSECGDTFLHLASLRRHLNARHGIRPTGGVDAKEGYTCEQCGKTFKLKDYLRQHLRSRTHGGRGHTAQKK